MKREPLSPASALLNVVALAMLAGVLVALWLLYAHKAFDYYTTPLSVRGYSPVHRALRPSGTVGHFLGILGTLFLFSTLFYVARKRLKWLSKAGSPVGWLEFHIFCGVFGPILITYHTSLKFNGLVSVAYWSMVLVVVSGFVGRYLYVRIPKTIRGEELSAAEIEQRLAELKASLVETTLPPRQLHDLQRQHAALLRRISRLQRTKKLFQLWHVFHRPFVWVMFLVFLVHLSVAVYFGYTFFGR